MLLTICWVFGNGTLSANNVPLIKKKEENILTHHSFFLHNFLLYVLLCWPLRLRRRQVANRLIQAPEYFSPIDTVHVTASWCLDDHVVLLLYSLGCVNTLTSLVLVFVSRGRYKSKLQKTLYKKKQI